MEPAEASAKPDHVDGRNWENFPAGLRVLVVDDDPLCLKIIEQMLKRCNYEVFVCATAAKALEQLREKSHDFDLVLSDVYMPDMDGFKLLEAIGLELDLPVIRTTKQPRSNLLEAAAATARPQQMLQDSSYCHSTETSWF